jgi:hypothetical protein
MKITKELIDEAILYYEKWGNIRKVADFFGVERTVMGYHLGIYKNGLKNLVNERRKSREYKTWKKADCQNNKVYVDFLKVEETPEQKRERQLIYIKSKMCGKKVLQK